MKIQFISYNVNNKIIKTKRHLLPSALTKRHYFKHALIQGQFNGL